MTPHPSDGRQSIYLLTDQGSEGGGGHRVRAEGKTTLCGAASQADLERPSMEPFRLHTTQVQTSSHVGQVLNIYFRWNVEDEYCSSSEHCWATQVVSTLDVQ